VSSSQISADDIYSHTDGEGPDFSTLPPEILDNIALFAARVSRSEKSAYVSLDVLKMRLVCRSFAEAGRLAFVKIVRKSDVAIMRYSTIHLPTRNGELKQLEQILCSSPNPSLFAPLTTNVVYHVTCGASEPDDFLLEDMFNDPEMCEDEDGWYPGRADHIIGYNTKVLKKQIKLLNNFACKIARPTGAARLRKVLGWMSNLSSLRIETSTFWPENSDGPPAESHDIGREAYTLGLPSIMAMIPSTSITSLNLSGTGIYAFAGLFPTNVHRMFEKGSALLNIKSVKLSFTHRDSVLEDWEGGDCGDQFTSLSRADRVNHVMYFMANVQDLSLSCNDDNFDICEIEDSKWLEEVFRGLSFSKLHTLKLQNFQFSSDAMKEVVDKHKTTLKHVSLLHCTISHASSVQLLKLLRCGLSLSTAEIRLKKASLHYSDTELDMITKEFGIPGNYGSVDVGGYVLASNEEPKAETSKLN
jgi:hypothetical protein